MNGVADCQETLVANPGFDTGIAPWAAEYRMEASWNASDAAGSSNSGSVQVENQNVSASSGMVLGGVSQCVAVNAGANYVLAVQDFIPAGHPAGSASVGVWYYGTTDCSGMIAAGGVFQGPLAVATGSWQTLSTQTQAPAGVRSAAVRLLVQKPGNQASMDVFFDNVLFRQQ
jgi:hypothetical protein